MRENTRKPLSFASSGGPVFEPGPLSPMDKRAIKLWVCSKWFQRHLHRKWNERFEALEWSLSRAGRGRVGPF